MRTKLTGSFYSISQIARLKYKYCFKVSSILNNSLRFENKDDFYYVLCSIMEVSETLDIVIENLILGAKTIRC